MNNPDLAQHYGIDGCQNGWLISSIKKNKINYQFSPTLTKFPFEPNATITIDMPLELPKTIDDYPKKSEQQAKKILGQRHSCIFYAPLATWLQLPYETINEQCTNHAKPKLSKQSYQLFPKIIELQTFKKQSLHLKQYESHPECVFQLLNQNVPLPSKKTSPGIEIRINLLNEHLLTGIQHKILTDDPLLEDIIDSLSMLWVSINITKRALDADFNQLIL